MVQVKITSQLNAQLQSKSLSPTQLAVDFAEWKNGHEDDHYLFGKDGLGRDSKYLYHVHMAPINVPEAVQEWNYCWENFQKRTSDRYLFYSNGGPRLGYLLIAITDDPGAHAIWTPNYAGVRQQFEKIADDFFHFGKQP